MKRFAFVLSVLLYVTFGAPAWGTQAEQPHVSPAAAAGVAAP